MIAHIIRLTVCVTCLCFALPAAAAESTETAQGKTEQEPREDIVIRTENSTTIMGRDANGDLIWIVPPAEPRRQEGQNGSSPILIIPEIYPPTHGQTPPPRPPRPNPRR